MILVPRSGTVGAGRNTRLHKKTALKVLSFLVNLRDFLSLKNVGIWWYLLPTMPIYYVMPQMTVQLAVSSHLSYH